MGLLVCLLAFEHAVLDFIGLSPAEEARPLPEAAARLSTTDRQLVQKYPSLLADVLNNLNDR